MEEDTRKKILDISKDQVLELYAAGPDAVIAFVEHIQNLINGLGEKIEAQQKIIEQQEERIRELEGIIKKDSHTSSKPPSSDGYAKRSIPQKKRSGKRPGGQKGHEGNTLRMVENPDQVVVHRVGWCKKCGRTLRKVKVCEGCGEVSTADFPQGITHKTQYGERLKAYAVYIKITGYCLMRGQQNSLKICFRFL
jgi:transposase